MKISDFVVFISEVSILIGFVVPIIVWICKLSNGMKCQLRSEMLRTYYHNKDNKSIRQYELENFIHLYEAYKALKGNSFVDKIYEEVESWEVIS